MDNRLREALRLVELGLAVHLLHPRSKEPIAQKWQQAPALDAELLSLLYQPGMEIGIHTGAVKGAAVPVVVLDLDTPESVEWALSRFPLSPVRCKTRRGEHWYFRHPGSPVATRHKPERLSLDVQGEGAHVVCPPSLHASGFVYAWIESAPSRASVESMPLWSRDWFPPPALPGVIWRPVRASRRGVARAIGAARKWRTYEESEGRGTQTFKLAQFITVECSLSPEQAFVILWNEWNPRLRQPYSESLLRRKINEALRSRVATAAAGSSSSLLQGTP